MSYYFNLQFKRVNRHLQALGFNVALAYILVAVVFTVASQALFEKIKFAEYLYIAIAALACYTLSEPVRNTYIKLLFDKKKYFIIRLLENSIIVLPFICFLLFQRNYIFALIVLFLSTGLSFISHSVNNRFILPTPFSKKPFEFLVGFRKNYLLFIACYVLAIIGIFADNFNLAIFALALCLFICLNFYTKPEHSFYVWIHTMKPSKFLNLKIQIAIQHLIIITLPICIILLFFYIQYWHITAVIVVLGMLYIVLMLLGKYAYYPAEINVIQILAIAFSIFFPPFLLFSIPYFYVKANQNLSSTVL